MHTLSKENIFYQTSSNQRLGSKFCRVCSVILENWAWTGVYTPPIAFILPWLVSLLISLGRAGLALDYWVIISKLCGSMAAELHNSVNLFGTIAKELHGSLDLFGTLHKATNNNSMAILHRASWRQYELQSSTELRLNYFNGSCTQFSHTPMNAT